MQYSDTKDQIFCRLCGTAKRELNGHLRMHKITSKEYKDRFPEAPIICENSSLLKSSSVKTSHLKTPRTFSEEIKVKIGEKSKEMHARKKLENEEQYLIAQRRSAKLARDAKGSNYTHSEITKEKMKGPRPCAQGIFKTDEHKKKLSEWRTGKKFKSHSKETIQKMKQAWIERKADVEKYSEYVKGVSDRMSTPEMIKKVRERTLKMIQDGKHNGKSRDTVPERKFAEFLDKHGITYEQQYIVHYKNKGSFLFDFYIPHSHLLVETDGEYWHKSKKQWNRDTLKESVAREAGYNVARISDKNWTPDIIFQTFEEMKSISETLLNKRAEKFKT